MCQTLKDGGGDGLERNTKWDMGVILSLEIKRGPTGYCFSPL